MKVLTVILALFVLTSCHRSGEDDIARHSHGMDRSREDLNRLVRLALEGDGDAAYQLYIYESLERHDEKASIPWLRKAAAARNAEAQRILARLIRSYGYEHAELAPTPQEAVRLLLSDACRNQSNACCEIALAFEEGYFGAPDSVAARRYFLKGAQMNDAMCWNELAVYLYEGKGGPPDTVGACYWASLDTQFVDPRSVAGTELWTARERLCSPLSPSAIQAVWAQVDAFVDGVNTGRVQLDTPPFLAGSIDPKLADEGRTLARKREAAYRASVRASSP